MPHVPMRAGCGGEVAACGSIAGASGCLPFTGSVEEQAVTTRAVTSAADTAVPAVTKYFDMESCSLRGVPYVRTTRPGPPAFPAWLCRAFCGLYPGTRQ